MQKKLQNVKKIWNDRFWACTLCTDPEARIRQMVKKIKKSTDGPIHFCYEADICGFSLQRQIEALGCCCIVIAPSLIPRKPGERIKTDRRDAKKMLSLFKKDKQAKPDKRLPGKLI